MIGHVGKSLILLGSALIVIGALLALASKVSWLGRLPGDIYIQKKNFVFYFPITTCIIASIVISVILLFLRRR